MEDIPRELEETQLNLQLVIDPKTKCLTMKTTNTEDADISTNKQDTIPPDILTTDDPLIQQLPPNLEEMNELERLICEERARLLNIKIYNAPKSVKKSDIPAHAWNRSRSKLRMRLRRQQQTPEEREFVSFRNRILLCKKRLLNKLRNFEYETPLIESSKRNNESNRKKCSKRKLKISPEKRTQLLARNHLTNVLRTAFRTSDDMLEAKEKNKKYREKYMSKFTLEERRAIAKRKNERVKQRKQKMSKEWKKIDRIINGAKPVDDTTDEDDELIEKEVLVVNKNVQPEMIDKDVIGGLVVEDLRVDNIAVKSEIIDFI